MNSAPINAFAINGNYTIPLTLGASVTLEAGLPITHVVFGTRGAGLAKLVVQGDLKSVIKPAPPGGGTMNRAPINAFAINGNYTIPLTLGASVARLRVESALNSKVAKTHRPKMATSLWLDARGKANLHMYSPQGDAAIRVQSAGSGRFGGKLRISGRGHLELAASLKPDWWRHVHASGSAAVKVLMVAERYGFPVIPSKYHPAHPSWQLPVGAEDWTFIVAPEGDRDAYRCSA